MTAQKMNVYTQAMKVAKRNAIKESRRKYTFLDGLRLWSEIRRGIIAIRSDVDALMSKVVNEASLTVTDARRFRPARTSSMLMDLRDGVECIRRDVKFAERSPGSSTKYALRAEFIKIPTTVPDIPSMVAKLCKLSMVNVNLSFTTSRLEQVDLMISTEISVTSHDVVRRDSHDVSIIILVSGIPSGMLI